MNHRRSSRSRCASVAVGDFNGDGKADLAVATTTGLAVMLGNGTDGFSAPALFTRESPGPINALAVGDLDGDGEPDVAIAAYAPSGVTYFKDDGAGGFSRRKSYLTRHISVSIVAIRKLIAVIPSDTQKDE